MYSLDSKIEDIYNNPIGFDIISKILLQMDVSSKIISNPIVSKLKLKSLTKVIDPSLFEAIIKLLNNHLDEKIDVSEIELEAKWWKEAVFYQIYPRSFCDSNNDGFGDLRGIISKLDYLKDLGVDCIWLSPIYLSPDIDNGYDISDYYQIDPKYGTNEEFLELINLIHDKGMKLIMDLVVNHTSDQHPWFLKALANNPKYLNYYTFKEQPNNWKSFFSEKAWSYYPSVNKFALHLFSDNQMDLNFENNEVMVEVIKIINHYLEIGVDGFRMDVINYIAKDSYNDGNKFIGELMEFYGIENYFYGKKLNEYLRVIHHECFNKYQAFSIGETPGVGREMSKLLTGDYRKELDMNFNFDHLENPKQVRFSIYNYDLNYLKKYYIDYLNNYDNHYWMALFFENHDNPRMVSKIDKTNYFNFQISTMLAMMLMTLKGTPFIFQGQELGMVNKVFNDENDFKDVESINKFRELKKLHGYEKAFEIVCAGSRDNARVDIDFSRVNNQYHDFFKKIIAIRKNDRDLVYKEIRFTNIHKKNLFSYFLNDKYYVEINLSNKFLKTENNDYQLVISNYNVENRTKLGPYEAKLFLINKNIT